MKRAGMLAISMWLACMLWLGMCLGAAAAGPCARPYPLAVVLEQVRAAALAYEFIASQPIVDALVDELSDHFELDETPNAVLVHPIGDAVAIVLVSDDMVCRMFQIPPDIAHDMLRRARGWPV
jgi:hypothetical protein